MDSLSLQTKIKLNLGRYTFTFNYLNLYNGSFIIYTSEEIILFNKNLSFKKIFPPKNDKESYIKLVKYINKGKILCLHNNNYYIFTINSKEIISKIKINFEKGQEVLDIIGFKNDELLAITHTDILNIKINDNKEEIYQISKVPKECLLINKKNHKLKNYDFKLSINIYELTNDNILIASESIETYFEDSGCVRGTQYSKKYKVVIFNIDKCKIIHHFQISDKRHNNDYEFSFQPKDFDLIIIINNKYICISNIYSIYIYNKYDYILIKEIKGLYMKISNFDDNMVFIIFIKSNYMEYILYDLSDINNIKYKNFSFEEIIPSEHDIYYGINIKKLSNGKILVIYDKTIFIIKYTKQFKLLPYNEINYY